MLVLELLGLNLRKNAKKAKKKPDLAQICPDNFGTEKIAVPKHTFWNFIFFWFQNYQVKCEPNLAFFWLF